MESEAIVSTQEIMHDVPPEKLAMVLAQYQSVGAAVQVSPQTDGNFTVTATFAATYEQPLATRTVEDAAPSPVIDLMEKLDSPIKSIQFSNLADEYRKCYDAFIVSDGRRAVVDATLSRLIQLSPRYASLARELSVPWEFIALIHKMEANTNFSCHLHNGDPLTSRTVHVPKGRPIIGTPPFSWEESARDALQYDGFSGRTDWNTATILYRLERFNGMGYREHGIFSPYLWSFSTLYRKGRFVADHQFDPESISQQCGAALLLKGLRSRNAADT